MYMNPIVVTVIIIIVLLAISALVIFMLKKRKSNIDNASLVQAEKESLVSEQNQYEMRVKFEDLPSLTEQEESQLVEIKDNSLLARIDNVIPGTLQALANSNAIKASQETLKNQGQLYQLVMPKGAELYTSKDMAGAVRAIYKMPGQRGLQVSQI